MTRALANWVLVNRPAFIINYHSAGGFMFGAREGPAGDLATAYAEASGYSWPAPGVGGQRSPLPYAASAQKVLNASPDWVLAEHGGPFEFNAEDFRRRVRGEARNAARL